MIRSGIDVKVELKYEQEVNNIIQLMKSNARKGRNSIASLSSNVLELISKLRKVTSTAKVLNEIGILDSYDFLIA